MALVLLVSVWPSEGSMAGEPAYNGIVPTPLDIKVIKARHQDMTGYNVLGLPITEWWSEDDLARMVFSDPTDITTAMSVKRYWEEVSSGGLVVGGSIEPGVIVIESDAGFKGVFPFMPGFDVPCDDPVAQLSPDAFDACYIQDAAGAEPQLQTEGPTGEPLTKLECDIARVLDAYLGVGEGHNWLGDQPEDVFAVMFPDFKPDNMCWNIGRGYQESRSLFGKRVLYAADMSNNLVNPYYPDYTVENWMEVQIGLIAHEVGHTMSLGHENGSYCEITNPDGSYTPVMYSNLQWTDPSASWCADWDWSSPDDPWDVRINNRTSLMAGSGWWSNSYKRIQDQYHGGHVSMWSKLNNDYSTWVNEETVKYLVPGLGDSKNKWTFTLSPAEQDQREPDLNHYAAAILEIDEFEQFLLEFRRPAEDNPWDFDQFAEDDPLVNGLLVYKIEPSPYWAGKAVLLDCNPAHMTYEGWEFWDVGPEIMADGRSHDDAACAVGKPATFFVRTYGTDKRVRIHVMHINTLPGDQWLKVRVTVKDCELQDETWDDEDEDACR